MPETNSPCRNSCSCPPVRDEVDQERGCLVEGGIDGGKKV